jgi:hypothetical protein
VRFTFLDVIAITIAATTATMKINSRLGDTQFSPKIQRDFLRYGLSKIWYSADSVYSAGQTFTGHFTDQYYIEFCGSPFGYTNLTIGNTHGIIGIAKAPKFKEAETVQLGHWTCIWIVTTW